MRGLAIIVAAATAASGCIESSLVECGTQLCPVDSVCMQGVCIRNEQITACEGKAELDSCATASIADGVCTGGVCVIAGCGNSLIEHDEACDDGNTLDLDGCSATCRSNETCGNGEIDFLRAETCDDANLRSGDGCSAKCATEQLEWRTLGLAIPNGRAGPGFAYDPSRRRWVAFSGYGPISGLPISDETNETWEFDGDQWMPVTTNGAPPTRNYTSLAYHAALGRIVMFGGYSRANGVLGDTWLFDGSSWTELTSSTALNGYDYGAMTYDSRRKRIVMWGEALKTWELDATATWHEIVTPTKPSTGVGVAMAYDPVRDKIVMFGGLDGTTGTTKNETWIFDGTTWALRPQSSPPAARWLCNVAFDPARGELVMYGGFTDLGLNNELGDTWAFDGADWNPVVTGGGIGSRGYHGMTSDPKGGVMLFGGQLNGVQLADMWRLDGTQWTQPAQVSPSGRYHSSLVYDDTVGRLIMFGGSPLNNQTWSLADNAWRLHLPAAPPARYSQSMVHDPWRGNTVLFGGRTAAASPVPNDTWVLDSSDVWTKLTTATAPSMRWDAAITYDTKRHLAILFGGDSATTRFDDTWTFDGTTWSEVATPIRPPPRSGAQLAYDPISDRVILFGGWDLTSALGDQWAFDGTTWTELHPPALPPARGYGGMVFEPSTGFLVVYGGYGDDELGDTWTFDGTTWARRLVPGPIRRHSFGMAYDARNSRVVLHAGQMTGNFLRSDVWFLDYRQLLASEACEAPVDYDRDGAMGCADDDCWSQCAPLCPPNTSCDPAAPHCGDGQCFGVEGCRLCPGDCGVCPVGRCGDLFCDAPETAITCPGDCP